MNHYSIIGTRDVFQTAEERIPNGYNVKMESARPGNDYISNAEGVWEEGISVAQQNREARKYLADTDWYITRKQETGEAVPEEVSILRSEARLKVV